MSNILQARIESIQSRINSGVATKEKLAAMEKGLHTDLKDLIDYQNLQAAAHASGKISSEVATQLYNALGRENPTEEKWDKLSIATKVAITQMMLELIDWRLSQGGVLTSIIPTRTAARKRKPMVRKTTRPEGLGGVH
jgi:hypothetical protein